MSEKFKGRTPETHEPRGGAPFRANADFLSLLYIANNRLPTEKAHGLQIVKTCEAFLSAGVNLMLWIPRRQQPKSLRDVSLEEYYGIGRQIPRRFLWCIDLLLLRSERQWADRWGVFAFLLQSLTFYVNVGLRLIFRSRVPLYSRDLPVVMMGILLGYSSYYEAHGFPSHSWSKRFHGWILRGAKGVIVITESLKILYEKELAIASSKIIIASDGVDVDQFAQSDTLSARGKLNLDLEKIYLVYTGNLYPWKGVYTLAKALKHLHRINVQLLLVGGDRHDGAFESLQDFIHCEKIPSITMVGHVPPQKVADYLAAADILILPNSASDPMSREYTSPLKLFEYMAAGKPIIASNVPALQEVLDAETALFFRADDEKDLAAKIKELMDQPKKYQKMAEAAQKEVRHYTWDERLKKILGLLFP